MRLIRFHPLLSVAITFFGILLVGALYHGRLASPHERSYLQLLSGIRKFRGEVYPAQKALYEQLERDGQQPHTLIITCADSRIDPELLTQAGPGEIFVARNIGNIVPAYGEMLGGVSAVIEYAVSGLGVHNIVVCGHTDCGAIKGLLDQSKLSKMPTVKGWLRNAEAALSVVQALHPDLPPEDSMDELIEANVLLQLQHLRTHPAVAGSMARGSLAVHGWVYDIGSGSIRAHNSDAGGFEEIASVA
jgi:carbonic anhydrase